MPLVSICLTRPSPEETDNLTPESHTATGATAAKTRSARMRSEGELLAMRKVLLVAVVLILGMAGWWWVERWMAPPLPGPPVSSPIASTPPSLSAEARGLPTLAPMLRRTMQSVVSITVQAQAAGEDNSLYKDPFYRRYFWWFRASRAADPRRWI